MSATQSPTNPVVNHIEAAVNAAEESGMSACELIGLLYFYAHNVAQDAREHALATVEANGSSST